MVITKKEKELVSKVIAEWKKKYPQAKLVKIKEKKLEEAMEISGADEIFADIFYDELAGEGQNLARKMLKGKVSPPELEDIADLVWDELINNNLQNVSIKVV